MTVGGELAEEVKSMMRGRRCVTEMGSGVMDFGGVSGSGCHEFGMMGASRMWDDAGFVRRLLEQREAVPFDGGGCRGGGRLRFVVATKKVANVLAHYYSDVGCVGLMMVHYTFLYGCNCEFPLSSGRGG